MMIYQTMSHVNHVVINVKLVLMVKLVPNVLKEDIYLQVVHLSHLTLNLLKLLIFQLVPLLLLLVKPNVLNVLSLQVIVNNVMLTEKTYHSVHVLLLDIMKMNMRYVNHVQLNVHFVLTLIIVINVLKTDNWPLLTNVFVHLVPLTMVKLIAHLVNSHVLNVLLLLIIVNFVMESELTYQIVSVHTVTSKLIQN